MVASFHTAWYDNTQHYAPTTLRHSLNVGVGESDKGECSRLGGDGLVKENTVHSAGGSLAVVHLKEHQNSCPDWREEERKRGK